MGMTVFHGSNHNFMNFRIGKDLVEHRSTMENEGLGIYFSTNVEVARSYGKYLYIVDMGDANVMDFRKKSDCEWLLMHIAVGLKKYGIQLSDYITVQEKDMIIDRMYFGGQSISGLGNEIYNWLLNNEKFCSQKGIPVNSIRSYLKDYTDRRLDAYLFPYHIQNIGVIKKSGLGKVRIIDKVRI